MMGKWTIFCRKAFSIVLKGIASKILGLQAPDPLFKPNYLLTAMFEFNRLFLDTDPVNM